MNSEVQDAPVSRARSRSDKGERTLNAILKAVGKIVHNEGLIAASQDHVARTAGISQSTLRHYFPTKEELIKAYFTYHYQTNRQNIEAILLQPMTSLRERIREIAQSHLDHIQVASDVIVFESWALMGRDEVYKEMRDDWYGFLSEHYAALIRQLNPKDSEAECISKANQILTISFGAWITVGRSRPEIAGASSHKTLRDDLLDLIDKVVGG